MELDGQQSQWDYQVGISFYLFCNVSESRIVGSQTLNLHTAHHTLRQTEQILQKPFHVCQPVKHFFFWTFCSLKINSMFVCMCFPFDMHEILEETCLKGQCSGM